MGNWDINIYSLQQAETSALRALVSQLLLSKALVLKFKCVDANDGFLQSSRTSV